MSGGAGGGDSLDSEQHSWNDLPGRWVSHCSRGLPRRWRASYCYSRWREMWQWGPQSFQCLLVALSMSAWEKNYPTEFTQWLLCTQKLHPECNLTAAPPKQTLFKQKWLRRPLGTGLKSLIIIYLRNWYAENISTEDMIHALNKYSLTLKIHLFRMEVHQVLRCQFDPEEFSRQFKEN